MDTRTCANCFNFNPNPNGTEPSCWAGVLLGAGASQREPVPADCCELHSTDQEGAAAIAAAYPTDPELRELVQRQLAGENELQHIANQAAAQVITAEVLAGMREGGAQ